MISSLEIFLIKMATSTASSSSAPLAASSSSGYTMAGLLETLHVKGPCTVSEVGYRTAKEIHRKLMSMFKPVAAGVFEGLVEPYVVVSDNPKMVGLPPGLRAEGNLAELWCSARCFF